MLNIFAMLLSLANVMNTCYVSCKKLFRYHANNVARVFVSLNVVTGLIFLCLNDYYIWAEMPLLPKLVF